MKMTAREQNKAYHDEIMEIMREEGIIMDEERHHIEQYLWNSLEKGVN